MRRSTGALLGLLVALAACTADPTDPSGSAASRAASPGSSTAASVSPAASASASVTPTEVPTPEPSLSLDPPETLDDRVVAVDVAVEVPADAGGRILVTVTSRADSMITELVLRWPTELGETLLLAPFAPSDERIRDGGPPLVQPWTKWVVGPGERGEPAGTISLGWGPLLAGAQLQIPVLVERIEPGPVAFDLQVLAGNDLLTLPRGAPAEFRIEVP